jgi:hypothetical protein
VRLTPVEAKTGSNWIAKSQQGQMLEIQLPGKPLAPLFLNPLIAAYATVQLSGQPTGTIWGAKVAVQPILLGSTDTAARIRTFPDLLQRRLLTGNTSIPVNPFATNGHFLENPPRF